MKDKKVFYDSLGLLAKSSVIVFIGIFLSKILSYVYRVIIARQFGPEAYGLFSLAVMLSGWIIVIATLGLNEGVLRYISLFRGKREIGKIQYVIRASAMLLAAAGVLGGVILYLSAPFLAVDIFHNKSLIIFLRIFSFIVPLSVVGNVFLPTLRAYEEIGWHSFISNILTNVLHVSSLILLIILGFGIKSIPLSYFMGALFVFFTAFIVCKYKIPNIFKATNINSKNKSNILKELISYSWPLLFVGAVWRVFSWTDSFLIGYFKNASDVGIYNAALPIALLISFSSQLFLQLFYPLINKEYALGNKELIRQLSQQVGKWIYAIILPFFILLLVFPEIVLTILFGPEYVSASSSLRILSFGILFISLFEISLKILNMEGSSKKILVDILLIATLNFILNIILIPRYGINGAALSTTISFISLSIIVGVQAYKSQKIVPLRRKMLNISFAALIPLGVLLIIMLFIEINVISFFLLSIFFCALYVLFVFLFKGLDRNDIIIGKSIIKGIKSRM